MIIYTYYCLTYRLSFTFYTASWSVLFQKASLSIILRRELLGTTLKSPEQSCLQGSFAPDHNTVLALKPEASKPIQVTVDSTGKKHPQC